MKKLIISLFALFALCACRTPKVMRYYKSENTPQTINSQNLIDNLFKVNAFVLDPAAGADKKTISSLSDKAQGALVEALNSKTKTPEELIAAITLPLEESASLGDIKGSLTWKKRIVINITKMDKEHANRVQQVLFTLEIPDSLKSKVEFVSWDKIVTETQSIDLGKITSGNTTGFSISPEITMAGFIEGKLPGAVSSSSTFGEEKSLTRKMAGLNAAIVSPSKFLLFRQAFPNEDISGNIVIELTLKSNLSDESKMTHQITGLYNGSTIVSDQSKIELFKSPLIEPNFGTSSRVPIDLTYQFRYRSVGKGKRTEPEYDDRITYIDGNYIDSNKFSLFDKEEMTPSVWKISDGSNSLHITKNGKTEILQFSSFNKAAQFLEWINVTKNLEVANYKLLLGLNSFTVDDIQKLNVQLME